MLRTHTSVPALGVSTPTGGRIASSAMQAQMLIVEDGP